MERLPPPIQPFKTPSSADPTNPPTPLMFNEVAQLESYLPAPRSDYLPETSPSKSISRSHADSKDVLLPHVTLTYAQSFDAQISLQPGTQSLLSGPRSKAMTHYLRSRHDAILVGAGTAKADNPGLNTRYSEDGKVIVGLERQPRPLVLDPSGTVRVEHMEKCFGLAERGEGRAPRWIVCREVELEEGLKSTIIERGGGVLDAGVYGGSEEGVDWEVVLRGLAGSGIRSVMIEGGGAVIKDLLRKRNQKYISSVIVTIAPTYLGAGGVGIAPKRSVATENEVNLRNVQWVPLGRDVVMAGVLK